jgi:hypothetical protein
VLAIVSEPQFQPEILRRVTGHCLGTVSPTMLPARPWSVWSASTIRFFGTTVRITI